MTNMFAVHHPVSECKRGSQRYASQWCATWEVSQWEEQLKPCCARQSSKNRPVEEKTAKSSLPAAGGRCGCGRQCSRVRKRQLGWDFLLCVENGDNHKECCATGASLVFSTVCLSMLPCYHTQHRFIHIWWGWNGSLICCAAVNMIWNVWQWWITEQRLHFSYRK